jgi:predicted dehydrogenase
MKNQLRVGLASYGMSGSVFHAPLISAHPSFRLVKVLERNKSISKEKYPDVLVVRSFDDLLESDIDVVVVNTPNITHYLYAKKAIEAGKHVVVEKPFTTNIKEGEELIDLAQKNNVILTVFQNRRWDSDFLTTQQVLKSKLLGRIVEFEAHYDRYRNYIQSNTWKEQSGQNGGILYNLGSHTIDQALLLFGMPDSVTAIVDSQRTDSKVDDYYHIILAYQGLTVILKSSYLVREEGPRYIIHGTEGSFVKHGIDIQEEALLNGVIPGSVGWGREHKDYWGLINTEANGLHITGKVESLAGNYLDFYTMLYEAIVENKPLLVKPEQALDVIRIIEAAFKSNTEKRTIIIK